ncbi:MAG: hypothetical protein ACRC06_15315 [Waterburya sp.]
MPTLFEHNTSIFSHEPLESLVFFQTNLSLFDYLLLGDRLLLKVLELHQLPVLPFDICLFLTEIKLTFPVQDLR